MFGRAQLPLMQKKYITKFAQSFIFLPMLTTFISGTPFLNLTGAAGQTVVFVTSQTTNEEQEAFDNKQKTLDSEGQKIDAYFESHGAPLAGYGRKMAEAALENDLDYRLLPAIAMRESTGGIQACKRFPENKYGWGSCKIGLGGSDDAAIKLMAAHLGGNNPKTEHYYKNKSVKEILIKYNPPHIVERYSQEVMEIMKDISPEPITD